MTLEEKIVYFESKMQECRNTMDNLNAALAELKEEAKQKEQVTRFEPGYGESYLYVSRAGDILQRCTGNGRCDENIAKNNNIFRTTSEANLEKYAHDVIRVQNRLMQLHEELCPEHFPDWTETSVKYTLYYSHGFRTWKTHSWRQDNINTVCFTREAAERACIILNTEKFMMEE